MIGQAYFPSISHPEGLPLKVQDVKGKEWVFQFRFWPNNNSRMYVLEGITPCIQSMQLQAGDVGNQSVPPNSFLIVLSSVQSDLLNFFYGQEGFLLPALLHHFYRSITESESVHHCHT